MNKTVQAKMNTVQKSSWSDPGFFIQKMKTYFAMAIALKNIRMLVANIILESIFASVQADQKKFCRIFATQQKGPIIDKLTLVSMSQSAKILLKFRQT